MRIRQIINICFSFSSLLTLGSFIPVFSGIGAYIFYGKINFLTVILILLVTYLSSVSGVLFWHIMENHTITLKGKTIIKVMNNKNG